MEIVRTQLIPPQNVFKELLRVSNPVEKPPCKRCGIQKMCGKMCTGAEEEVTEILKEVVVCLDQEGMSSELEKLTFDNYMIFVDKMKTKNKTYMMSANKFVDELQEFFKFPSCVLPIIGTVSFPMATNIRNCEGFEFAKPSKKRTRNMLLKEDKMKNEKESSSEWSSDDDEEFEIQIIKKRKMNNGNYVRMK